ncbi:3,5-diaminobexanoate dehydrogenase [Carbonactinospora thermoautotrophica]|uniref:3,5-diaminobexanoate dehydrogenase n=1 Tax=Carbonactinospora thermoautotrophica TaxID=1469144 RepID=A0A132MSY7_9ACTN|nr:3,5-diaminobexanoate dehydrogenase [Carbonactinospora thermoautotrophica]
MQPDRRAGGVHHSHGTSFLSDMCSLHLSGRLPAGRGQRRRGSGNIFENT